MVWYINLYEFRGKNVHGLHKYTRILLGSSYPNAWVIFLQILPIKTSGILFPFECL